MAKARKVLCKGGCGRERDLGPPAKARREENYTTSPSWTCDECAAKARPGGKPEALPEAQAPDLSVPEPKVVERAGGTPSPAG